MEGMSKKIGEPCPSCATPLVRKPKMFAWRGELFDGAVCEPCNALYAIEGEEMPPLRKPVKGPKRKKHPP